jgi:hypothetical protein
LLLELRIGQAGIDFIIELVDDLGGDIFRRADAEPRRGLVARHELRQAVEAGHELEQLAGDVRRGAVACRCHARAV